MWITQKKLRCPEYFTAIEERDRVPVVLVLALVQVPGTSEPTEVWACFLSILPIHKSNIKLIYILHTFCMESEYYSKI